MVNKICSSLSTAKFCEENDENHVARSKGKTIN